MTLSLPLFILVEIRGCWVNVNNWCCQQLTRQLQCHQQTVLSLWPWAHYLICTNQWIVNMDIWSKINWRRYVWCPSQNSPGHNGRPLTRSTVKIDDDLACHIDSVMTSVVQADGFGNNDVWEFRQCRWHPPLTKYLTVDTLWVTANVILSIKFLQVLSPIYFYFIYILCTMLGSDVELQCYYVSVTASLGESPLHVLHINPLFHLYRCTLAVVRLWREIGRVLLHT